VVGVLVQVVDDVPGIRDVNEALNRNAEIIAWPAAIISAAGIVVFVLGLVLPGGPKQKGKGRQKHRPTLGTFDLAALKRAWASGAIWRERMWLKRSLVFAGALIAVFGVFSLAFALSPPAFVKLLIAPALLYMLVRLGWGLYRL
jgi:hypothetical protein